MARQYWGGTGGPFGVCTRRPIGFTRAIIQAMFVNNLKSFEPSVSPDVVAADPGA